MSKKKQRVVIAMSGGVDSSVAAAILKNQGYDVVGIFMKLWAEQAAGNDLVRENICCSADAAAAARAVAAKIGIPFYVVNFAKEFKERVVDYYIKEYESGRTPNPCVICNRDIKGELLMRKVLDVEADFLATGHYARREMTRNPKSEIRNSKNRSFDFAQDDGPIKYHLYQAKDTAKDQTYFLWTLTQEQLAKTLFPIGDYTKTEVRTLAKKMKLPTAERKESQGICFIPDRDTCGFLRRYAQKLTEPGEIVDLAGNKLGLHAGLVNYTVGQRERLGLGGPRAYYVVKLESRANRLIVGNENDLYRKKLIASEINLINPKLDLNKLAARIRYRHPIENCQVKIKQSKFEINFEKPQRAITPGQSVVFYQPVKKYGWEVVGGGVID